MYVILLNWLFVSRKGKRRRLLEDVWAAGCGGSSWTQRSTRKDWPIKEIIWGCEQLSLPTHWAAFHSLLSNVSAIPKPFILISWAPSSSVSVTVTENSPPEAMKWRTAAPNRPAAFCCDSGREVQGRSHECSGKKTTTRIRWQTLFFLFFFFWPLSNVPFH